MKERKGKKKKKSQVIRHALVLKTEVGGCVCRFWPRPTDESSVSPKEEVGFSKEKQQLLLRCSLQMSSSSI